MTAWLESLGAWASVVAPLVSAAAALLPIPSEMPAAAIGMAFSLPAAVAITWSGSLAGAWASFELARRLGRPWLARRVHPSVLARVDELAVRGRYALLVARFIPLISFHVLNYGLGLTLLSRGTFLWTTAVGIVPGAVAFSAGGAALRELYARAPLVAIPLTIALAVAVVWMAWRRAEAAPPER